MFYLLEWWERSFTFGKSDRNGQRLTTSYKMDSFAYMVAFRKAGWWVTAQGDVEGKMSQKSSIIKSVSVLQSSATIVSMSSRAYCPWLSNGPNCAQINYTHNKRCIKTYMYMNLQSVHIRPCFPSTPPVTVAACAVVHWHERPCPPHNAACYNHLGPGSKA